MNLPDVSVVIPSYNVWPLLDQCLHSLANQVTGLAVDVVVVDNASADGTPELVRENHPRVRVIANSHNRGFGQAANQGFDLTRGEMVLLLNPDTTLAAGVIDCLVGVLRGDPAVGVVGPRLRYPDGRLQSTRRRFPTPLVAVLESTSLQAWFPRAAPLRWYYVDDRPDMRQDVDWLVGACLLVKRAVIQDVGGFDEQFFMYSEELDWCRRIKRAGWRIRYVPEAEIIHHEGRSSEQNLARRATNFQESKCRYFEKYFGPRVGRALRIFLLGSSVYELALEATKLGLGHRPGLRRRRLRALLSVTRSQLSAAKTSS